MQLLQFGGKDLHFFHAAIRLRLGNPEDGLKQNGQDDDRPAVVADPLVDGVHHHKEGTTDDSHPAKLHHLILPLGETPQAPIFFRPCVKAEFSNILCPDTEVKSCKLHPCFHRMHFSRTVPHLFSRKIDFTSLSPCGGRILGGEDHRKKLAFGGDPFDLAILPTADQILALTGKKKKKLRGEKFWKFVSGVSGIGGKPTRADVGTLIFPKMDRSAHPRGECISG